MPTSLTGEYGPGLTDDIGAPPVFAQMLESLPSAYATAGWNSFRGARTILHGGFDETLYGRFKRTKSITRRVFGDNDVMARVRGSNPFGRSFTRFANQDMLHSDIHSPVGQLAGLGNKLVNWSVGKNANLSENLMSRGIVERNAEGKIEPFSGGFFARQDAAQRIMWRGKSLSGKRLSSVERFIGKDPGIAKGLERVKTFGTFGMELNNSGYSHLVGASMKGTASQYLGGYLRGATTGAPDALTRGILEGAGKKAYLKGADAIAENFGKAGIRVVEGSLMKEAEGGLMKIGMREAFAEGGVKVLGGLGARALGYAIPGVDIAMLAMTAYDLTKMGTSLMKSGFSTLVDAGKSFKGSIEKGPMGMGYKDTTVAATSRQRGVMAIQASRLNARSVLGSEAGMMAAHFG